MMANINNIKKNPVVVMSQINTSSAAFSRSSSSTSVSGESKSQATISSPSTQNNVSIGDLQCCGRWWSSSKSYHRHLVDAAQSDPQHENKLFQIGMRRCSLCPMWVHKNAMTQHIKRNHTTKITGNISSPDTTVNRIQGQHQSVGSRVTLPNSTKNEQQSGTPPSRGNTPGYIIRVSGQPQQFVRVGVPAQQINRATANTAKAPNTGQKVQQINRVTANTVKAPNTVQKAQFKNAGGSMLPSSIANTVITDKNGQTLGYKVGGTQFVTKKTITADGVQKLTIGTLGSVRKMLPVAKGAEVQNQARSEYQNIGNQDKMLHNSTVSKGESISPLAYVRKDNTKTYKGANPSTQIVRKNITGTNISYNALQQSSETVEISSPVEPKIETSTIKVLNKKKRKQTLSPSVESVDMVTIDKEDTGVGMHSKIKEIKKPTKKQRSTPASVDNSINENDNVTPKSQKKNSRGSKGASNKNKDSSYTPVAASRGRGKGRNKAAGRPGRPRRIVMENSEPHESESFSGVKGDDENIENEPEMDMKKFKVEENVPEVELDLFTLPSVSEKQCSVLLVEPKNPNFKVYASMDAIFVGDSALGDVTNQIGYITDMNNVVFVNPEHFLFPNVKDIDNFVPKPLLIMKCSKNMGVQSKTQSNSSENLKSPPKAQVLKDTETESDIHVNRDTQVGRAIQEDEPRLIGRSQILKYLQGTNAEKSTAALKDSSPANIESPLKDSKQAEPKPSELFSEVNNSNKELDAHVSLVKTKTPVVTETPSTPCKNSLGDNEIDISNNSSKIFNKPSTIDSKTNSTLEENIGWRRMENILDSSNDNSITVDADKCRREIKEDLSNKKLKNENENKLEMMDNGKKSEKQVLDSQKQSLVNSPSTGLISTKLGLKIPKPVTVAKKLEETNTCKGIDISVESEKKVDELHIMAEPHKFNSSAIDKTNSDEVSVKTSKIDIGSKQNEYQGDDNKGINKLVGSEIKVNAPQVMSEPVIFTSPVVNVAKTDLVGGKMPELIPGLKQLDDVNDRIDLDKPCENMKTVKESHNIKERVKYTTPDVSDKNTDEVKEEITKPCAVLKQIEETEDVKDGDKSVENIEKVSMSQTILDKSDKILEKESESKANENTKKLNELDNMSKPVKSSHPVVNTSKTNHIEKEISNPISRLKKLEDTDDCKDLNKSVENTKQESNFHNIPEPAKSCSSLVDNSNTKPLDREILKLSPVLEHLETLNDGKCAVRPIESMKNVNNLQTLPGMVESSLPVVNTAKTEIKDTLGANNETNHSQIKSLKQEKNDSETIMNEDKLSIPLIQNDQCLSSRGTNNKNNKPFEETEACSKSQILKNDKSDNKKLVKSLRAFRSKSIDGVCTIEKKLSDKDRKTESIDLPENKVEFASGTNRSESMACDENLSSKCDPKLSLKSKISENMQDDTQHSDLVERLKEDSKVFEENSTVEEIGSKNNHENLNQDSKIILPNTKLKSFRSKSTENEISLPEESKLNKNSSSLDCKKSKFGSPPATNRDIRSFFQQTLIDVSPKPTKKAKCIEKESAVKESPKIVKEAKFEISKEIPKKVKVEKLSEKTSIKESSNSTKSNVAIFEKTTINKPILDNVNEERISNIKEEKNISLKVDTSEALENERTSSPSNKNLLCKKNKTTDIRDFFSPEKGKKRTSLELNEKCTSLELNESSKKVKTEQEPDGLNENLNRRSSLDLNEADFLGFDESLSISLQKSHLLSEIVNRLTLKHNIRKEEFAIPYDQILDSEEQLISNRIFTGR